MKKYLSLLLLGSMVQFAAVHAGGCKDGSCKKDRAATFCKDKPKKDK